MKSGKKAQDQNVWDSDLLIAKAQRYVEKMQDCDRDEWTFGLWSSLSLELLSRAALSNVSPTLLADTSDWNNLFYALKGTPIAPKFKPKSIATNEVIKRLGKIIPDFDSDLESFCIKHTGMRNSELHSGETPYDGVKSSTWLSLFYRSCSVLLKSMDHDLKYLIGDEEARVAKKVIAAAKDETAKAINGIIKSHQTVWKSKDSSDQKKLELQASAWATKGVGHRVKCPSCNSDAIIMGDAIGAPKQKVTGDLVVEKQEHLPNKFQCIACGLKISGLAALTACDLGEPYTKTITYDVSDFYDEPEDDMSEWEDDNND